MYFRCPICNKTISEMTPSHAKTHGMTKMEMMKKYPELCNYEFKYGINVERRLKLNEQASKKKSN